MHKCRFAWLFLTLATATQANSGYFSVTQTASGRWELLDPHGKAFYSAAVCVVLPGDGAIVPGGQGYNVLPIYKGDKAAWAKATVKRLRDWGFNSLGAWCDEAIYGQGLPYTISLALVGYAEMGTRLVDVFSPEFEAKMRKAAVDGTAKWKNDPDLIGYYLDNELPWYGDTGWPGPQNTPLLDKHLALGKQSAGYRRAVEVLGKHLSVSKKELLKGWPAALEARKSTAQARKAREAFLALAAEQYFSLGAAAVRAADPHHLILGARFAGDTPRPVIEACGRHSDVISVNHYSKSGVFDFGMFDTVYALTKRPVMLTEFSYRAMENRSGDKNTKGADVTVATQKDRAAFTQRFLAQAGQLKYLLGYHWFQYFDESPQGRSFDGEDSNYGLVDIYDKPYEELIAAFKLINRDAQARHETSARPLPDKAPEVLAVRVRQAVGSVATLKQPRVLAKFGSPDYKGASLWNEATASADFGPKDGKFEIRYRPGNGWGLGIALKVGDPDPASSIDILGATALKVTLSAPKGAKFAIFLNESGIADPSAPSHSGNGGSDGESYESAPLLGTGAPQAYRIDFSELQTRSSWGNTRGNKIVDLQAVHHLDIAIPGGQAEGVIVLHSIEAIP